jgi:hypothetical protein
VLVVGVPSGDLLAACSVTPTGHNGCRATLPSASLMPRRCSCRPTSSGSVPGVRAVIVLGFLVGFGEDGAWTGSRSAFVLGLVCTFLGLICILSLPLGLLVKE